MEFLKEIGLKRFIRYCGRSWNCSGDDSMIVSVNLSKGAMILAKNKVIVKHLDAIENLGVMDILLY